VPERSLLACYAHPDDETLCAGTMARYAAEGARVTLVCATSGDVGEIRDPALATPETLAQVREGELRCAATALGIGEPIFLGYRDSGMDGTPENQHPAAFRNANADEVAGRLVAIIRDVEPQVVVTFDATGGYGHPDHLAIHRHTLAAVMAAGDAARYSVSGPAWQVSRVYFSVFPRSFFDLMRERLVALGEDVSELDEFRERGTIGFADEDIHAIVDASGFVDAKFTAIACHRTQFTGESWFTRIGEAELRRLMSHEYFSQGWPEPSPGARSDGLFA
jgi:LmbE family N-acetylglucosaminyl deacetylase